MDSTFTFDEHMNNGFIASSFAAGPLSPFNLPETNTFSGIPSPPVKEFTIFDAASIGNFRLVMDYVRVGVDPNSANSNGWTPLMYAAEFGHFGVVEVLIDAGVNVNSCEWTKRKTALMMAAANGHTRCVELLVNKGRANIHQIDSEGNTAAFYAISHGHGDNQVMASLLAIAKPPTKSRLPKTSTPKNTGFRHVPSISVGGVGEHTEPKTSFAGSGKQMLTGPTTGYYSFFGGTSMPSLLSPMSPVKNSATDVCSSPLASRCGPFSTPNLARMAVKKEDPYPSTMGDLLDRLNLSLYKDLFSFHEIDLETFILLSDADVESIGVTLMGHRKQLRVAQLRLIHDIEVRSVGESVLSDWLLVEKDRLTKENQMLKSCILQLRDEVAKALTFVAERLGVSLSQDCKDLKGDDDSSSGASSAGTCLRSL